MSILFLSMDIFFKPKKNIIVVITNDKVKHENRRRNQSKEIQE